MPVFILKRILLVIPTIIAVSMVVFFLAKAVGNDPAASLLSGDLNTRPTTEQAYRMLENRYRIQAERMHLDQPSFYFSIVPSYWPDSLYRILPLNRRRALRTIITETRKGPPTMTFARETEDLYLRLLSLNEDGDPSRQDLLRILDRMKLGSSREHIQSDLSQFIDLCLDSSLAVDAEILQAEATLLFEKNRGFAWPTLRWHGWDNQYHFWIRDALRGRFGTSLRDARPVAAKIGDGLSWSLVINLLAFLIAGLLAIPIGVFSAVRKDSVFDKVSAMSLYALFSTPQFWLATLLLIFLTTSDYGQWTDWFPSGVPVFTNPDTGQWSRVLQSGSHLVLPVFCLTVLLLAFLARQMRNSTLEELSKEYVLNARSMGLPRRKIIWRYVLPNASFPMITYLGLALPFLITGSVVVETIFSVPGLGRMAVEALFIQDWPVLFAIVMLGAFVTMLGILLSDVLYAVVNPKIKGHGT